MPAIESSFRYFYRTSRVSKSYIMKDAVKAVSGGLYGTLVLLPIAGIVDGIRLNVKLSAKPFYQHLRSFYLEVGWASGFAISYNADANSLTTAVPASAWYY